MSSLLRFEPEPAGGNCTEGGIAVHSGLDLDGDGVLAESEATSVEYLCNGQGGQDGHSALFSTADEPAGGNCPSGGVAVHSGLDLDDDGVLDPAEVTATEYVCHGSDGTSGLTSLVSVMDEAPGENCASGGQVIRSGVDASGDGLLQPEEVDHTEYVCNGADGQPGTTSLVRQEDELPGGHCAFGGRLVLSGLDANGDGYLDDPEVSGASYVCNGAPGAPGHASLFDVVVEPAGASCAAGGYQVKGGLDVDDDGLLEPAEVTQTRYVCHGSDGADGVASLVATSVEPAGASCAAGGYRIEVGLDTDGDGVLDAAEVTQTRYVCHGADGQVSLLSTSAEPAGTNCTQGGQKLESGIDDNGNGVLDAGEVDETSYVCDGGDVLLRVSNAAWGGVCARGGVKVETGLDDDGDGVLADAEVDRIEYACNLYLAQLAAGTSHTCAVVSDGTARCWGGNGSGQLGNGDGTATTQLTPVAVSGLSGVAEIAAGSNHTCARLTDGTARCWGLNSYGQLGDGTTTDRLTPVAVSGLSGIAEIAGGSYHTCARLTDGTGSCWGRNLEGQLGDGTTTNKLTPVTVSGLSGVDGIASRYLSTCARLTDGTARCWGSNSYGQLGDGTTTNRPTAVTVSGLSGVAEIDTGSLHTCARLADGTGSCWGHNAQGQLGDSTSTERLTPVAVSGLSGIAEMAAGSNHSCARLTDGTARCWGFNQFGQVGDGTGTNRLSPVTVSGLSGVAEVASGSSHSCARLTDGTARCWGSNSSGQLGDNTATNRSTPAVVIGGLAP